LKLPAAKREDAGPRPARTVSWIPSHLKYRSVENDIDVRAFRWQQCLAFGWQANSAALDVFCCDPLGDKATVWLFDVAEPLWAAWR
jgi:hypothetical protein